jgi:serine/threonine protein kinase
MRGGSCPTRRDTYTPLSLVTWLTEHGPAPTSRVIAWGIELAEAIAVLHGAGLYHRDVKPANLLFRGGRPVLADYGSTGRAGSGIEFPGTEGYVPPDGMGSPALDVFALGRTLYELWTGLDRFHFPSLPPAVTGSADWNRHGWLLNAALLRAAEGRPSQRFRDAKQFRDALENAAQGNYRISRRKLIAASALGVGAVAAAYVWRNLPSHRAVWRRLSPARFGYEIWSGHALSCDWPNRMIYSLSHNPRMGLSWQSYDLKTWTHRERNQPEGSILDTCLLHPETATLWGVSPRTGDITQFTPDGTIVRQVATGMPEDIRFTGPVYWNPLTRRVGRFAGYGDFRIDFNRREFDPASGRWEMLPAAGPQPWPRMLQQFFPGPDRKTWFLFGGNGNPSGRQSESVEGLAGYDGVFYPLDDFWTLDLESGRWRQLLPVQHWRPAHLKAAIYHRGTEAVLFLTGSSPGQAQAAGLHLWPSGSPRKPQLLPASGDAIPLFRCWTLLVEPDTQDLWVFADEGVFAVSLRPV